MRLERLQFFQHRQLVLANTPPCTARNIAGMIVDFQHYFKQIVMIEHIEVHENNLPECLITASIQSLACSATLPDLIEAVENVWIKKLAYPEFEMHTIFADASYCVMECLTLAGVDA